MAEQKFANNVATTLAADVAIGAGTMQVTSASGFPSLGAGDWFIAAIFPSTGVAAGSLLEVVKVSNVAGTICTITRAQEGTTDTGATAGDIVIVSPPSKGTFEQLQDDIDAAEADIATNAADILTNAADIAANAAAIAAYPSFPSGTIMLFGQAAAPTGWTKKTDWADESVIVYSTGTPSSGGSAALNSHNHDLGSHNHDNGTLYINEVVKHRHGIGTKPAAGSSGYITSMASATTTTDYTDYEGSNTTVYVKGSTATEDIGNSGYPISDIKYQEVIAASKD